VPVAITPEAFGPRLRALRNTKGLSLSEFARRIYYSKGYLSRVETGASTPSAEFARRCDVELEADGALVALVPSAAPDAAPDTAREPADDYDDGTWIVTMAPDGSTSFVPLGRREMLLGGAVVVAGLAGANRLAWPPAQAAGENLMYHRQLLEAARGLGQVAAPQTVLPMVVGQAQALRALSRGVQGGDAFDVATLFARTAEFAGWMAQESGDDNAATWWTGKAVQIAAAAGDRHTAAYALVRRALITMYQGDAPATIGLARQAQSATGTPMRILGLAAQREAQGHALAGDYDECMRALERANQHLQAARGDEMAGPVIGTSHISDPVSVVTGWCLYDLSRPREAAEILDREISHIPISAVRARLRFGIRQALAHAAAGDLDRACELAQSMIGQTSLVGSATILADVRRLAATLRRWSSHPAVRALEPAFTAALYRGPVISGMPKAGGIT
jgi:transcriptional regulator with XRE-family HTH domain